MAGSRIGMTMQPLLYLVHRIPYPPNKGDKIRSFHLLKALAKQYDVCLGAFVDNKDDWQYAVKLAEYCTEIRLQPINKIMAKLKSLKGLISGDALSLQYYNDRKFKSWVDRVINKHSIEHVMIYSSPMAQYVLNVSKNTVKKRIADFVDIDSDKWRQYSRGSKSPMNWIYAREARKLLEFEKRVANIFDATVFVSEVEKKYFDKLCPQSVKRHAFYNNGVDSGYFDPDLPYSNPFPPNIKPVVFTGAMDYWANVDSVTWFAHEVFHEIKKEFEKATFYIVGSNPTNEVKALQKIAGITVTGSVNDIRPYIRYASVIVAPLRIARGVQNKVLEAMAMSRPIVASTAALEGIEICHNYKPFCADTAADYLEIFKRILNNETDREDVREARQCVLEKYNWDRNVSLVLDRLK